MAKKKAKRDIDQEITDKIIGYLEEGVAPWRHPIMGRGGAGLPKSLTTGKDYRGVNIFLLGMTSWFEGYSSAYWLTFNQCKKLDGTVRKGEQASLVTFWKFYDKEDKESGEVTRLPVLRHYNVFNAEQCDGITVADLTAEQPTVDFQPLALAENIVAGYPSPPRITHMGKAASYGMADDEIKIAPPERFESAEAYYLTLFHEMTHSSGHKKRLDRDELQGHVFGTANYSKEELTAEMGAAFLAAHAGISPPTIEQSAAYIENWLKRLKNDKKLVIQAAGKAQKAVDLILGVSFDEAAQPSRETPAPAARPPPVAEVKPSPKTEQLGFDF